MTQRRRSSSREALLLVLGTVCLLRPLAAAELLAPAGNSEEVTALIDKAKPAIVKVQSGDESLTSAGTGFFIDDQGTIATSATVVGDSTTARVICNGLTLDAKVLGNDQRSGLALLKVNYPGNPSLNLGHSIDMKTGYGVVALGYPLNLPVAATQGQVTGFEIHYLNRFFSTTHIHAGVPISPGQVGGPLLNLRGEVVGLVVPSPDDGQSVYALPVEAMEKIMSDFAQYGRAKHGWVGVTVVEAPDVLHDGRTVRVVEAVQGTPASKSGLQRGDTVLRIDARAIYRPSDVLDASFFSHVGANMTVVVRRNQQLLDYSFAVIERPQIPSAATPVSISPHGTKTQPVLVNRSSDK